MKNILLRKGLVFILPILFIIACEEDPTSIGNNLIPDEDKLQLVETNTNDLNIERSNESYLGEALAHSDANRVLLGKNDNVTYTSLLRFALNAIPDSVETSLINNELEIVKSKVTMTYEYYAGDKNADYSFEAFEIKENWKYYDFTEKGLDTLDIGNLNLASSIDSKATDSTVTFELSDDIILQWINARIDPDNYDYYGLVLKPKNENLVIGFIENGGFSLEVVIKNSANQIDTLGGYIIWDTHVAEGEFPSLESDELVVQSGLPVRTNMYFDVIGMLPERAAIIEATLELYADTTKSVYGNDDPANIYISLYEDVEKDSLVSGVGGALTRSGNKLSGNITTLVQYIVNNEKNKGFRLSMFDEHYGASKYVLMGHNAEEALKPKLTIFYSKQR
ncbi:MAG: hypothetical protein JEY94_14745 [Melioribacteraceae bacterium]|nr:hypothetical protein [Melioribacteraceae bacterium]